MDTNDGIVSIQYLVIIVRTLSYRYRIVYGLRCSVCIDRFSTYDLHSTHTYPNDETTIPNIHISSASFRHHNTHPIGGCFLLLLPGTSERPWLP